MKFFFITFAKGSIFFNMEGILSHKSRICIDPEEYVGTFSDAVQMKSIKMTAQVKRVNFSTHT